MSELDENMKVLDKKKVLSREFAKEKICSGCSGTRQSGSYFSNECKGQALRCSKVDDFIKGAKSVISHLASAPTVEGVREEAQHELMVEINERMMLSVRKFDGVECYGMEKHEYSEMFKKYYIETLKQPNQEEGEG